MKQLLEKIANPPDEFRGMPFWSWNDHLEKEELVRQISVFKSMGFGGFFIHPRSGLRTPYLSEEYFDCIKVCIDAARKENMQAGLYDDDRWPSGTAGGAVTKKDPKFKVQNMLVCEADKVDYQPDSIAFFAAIKEGENLYKVRKLTPGDELNAGETFFRFYIDDPAPDSWFNNGNYIDCASREAVRAFIDASYEKYYKHYGDEFGKTSKSIFTDEPFTRNWTRDLPEKFLQHFGYDIVERLPELFFHIDGQTTSRLRLNYYELLTELFVTNYAKQISDWCDSHNIALTGHIQGEDNITMQTNYVGSAMRFYEYMQIPGVDILTEHWTTFDSIKQCASVAHQLGRKRRLCELYGCTGWDFPFLGHKAIGDIVAVLGINLRCHHLAWYSMAGEAKRDYPASISCQSPFAPYYHQVEEYFTRLNSLLVEGDEARDILVIHPIESTWFGKAIPAMNKDEFETENRILFDLRIALLRKNLDFDYGDEEMMSRLGSTAGNTLSVGLANYRAVVIPPMRTIRKTTLDLLEKFAVSGGKVVYSGTIPEYVDGISSNEAKKVYAKFIKADTYDRIPSLLESTRLVSICADDQETDPVLYSLHRGEDFQTLFICNTGINMSNQQLDAPLCRDRKLAFPDVHISWQTSGMRYLYEVDLSGGVIRKKSFSFDGDKISFRSSFAPLQSRFFLATDEAIAEAQSEEAPAPEFTRNIVLPEKSWPFHLDENNVLLLDKPEYSIAGGVFNSPKNIYLVDNIVREALGELPRIQDRVQPYARQSEQPPKTVPVALRYKFNLSVDTIDLFLGIENPDCYRFKLNGSMFAFREAGFWCDKSLKKAALPGELLKSGENILEISCDHYDVSMYGLENIYILGNFGVDANNSIVALPDYLDIGDWVMHGLRFYSGNVTYIRDFDLPEKFGKVYLSIPEWRGTALAIKVNGSKEILLPWEPFVADISNFVRRGVNRLEIKVIGHRRNSHGPFYTEKWPKRSGPAEFDTFNFEEVQLVPCGLLAAPVLKIAENV